jgi:hypothetical protein
MHSAKVNTINPHLPRSIPELFPKSSKNWDSHFIITHKARDVHIRISQKTETCEGGLVYNSKIQTIPT